MDYDSMFQNALYNPFGQSWGQGNWGGQQSQINPFQGFNPFVQQGVPNGMDQAQMSNPFGDLMGFGGFDFGSLLGTPQQAPVLPPDITDPAPVTRTPKLTRQEKISDTLRNPNSRYNKELGRTPWGAR